MPTKQTSIDGDVPFWKLIRAIAAGDDQTAKLILMDAPATAVARATVGASRATAESFYLGRIGHYVYTGDTVLHIAAAAYDTDIARALVRLGANPRAANRRGATPLHYAATGGPTSAHWNPRAQAGVIALLIDAGADPDAIDKSAVAPLHVAARSRCAAAVRALLAHGANPRLKNGSGSTPLHLAVQTTGRGGSGSAAARDEQAAIIRHLIEHGGRLGDRNGRGQSVAAYIRGGRLAGLVR